MRIEAYFQRLRSIIEDTEIIQSHHTTYDKRSTHAGFVRGEIESVDGSVLHFREFIDVESATVRLMYTYHYVDADGKFLFRYDNTGHHKSLNLPTYPITNKTKTKATSYLHLPPNFTPFWKKLKGSCHCSEK